jgi:gamma-glutamyltranspeptidase/glutathione hydrolase
VAFRSTVACIAFAASGALAASPVVGTHGMVVTAQHLATKVGVDVLKAGGNAIDAAVAVGYALAVVYPAAGNLGGGGFMTIRLADGRKTFIDFREKAPLAAKRDMYLDRAGNVVPRASLLGHLAVAVPGSVAGLEYAREKYGTLKRAPLVAPAIALAEEGFTLEAGDVRALAGATKELRNDKRARRSSSRTAIRAPRGPGWCRRTWRGRCARCRSAAWTVSTRGLSRRPS